MSVRAIIEVTKFKLAIEMIEALQQVLIESISNKKRKSYSREEKLKYQYARESSCSTWPTISPPFITLS